MANKAKKIKKSTEEGSTEESIIGLVILRGKHVVSDSNGNISEVGLTLAPQDEQDVTLEIAVTEEFADTLKVDELYNAVITKGKGTNSFKVVSLNELDNGKYDEKMVLAGDLRGHLHLAIRNDQEEFFCEEKEYSLALSVVEAE